MVSVEQVREWVQHRIDYWETKAECEQCPPEYEDIEGRGQLAAFYMVIECIDGQRK